MMWAGKSKKDEIAEMIATTEVCLNCGKELPKNKLNVAYCGRKCYNTKRPQIAVLEYRYEKPLQEVINDLSEEYSLSQISKILKIKPQTLRKHMNKYNIK